MPPRNYTNREWREALSMCLPGARWSFVNDARTIGRTRAIRAAHFGIKYSVTLYVTAEGDAADAAFFIDGENVHNGGGTPLEFAQACAQQVRAEAGKIIVRAAHLRSALRRRDG